MTRHQIAAHGPLGHHILDRLAAFQAVDDIDPARDHVRRRIVRRNTGASIVAEGVRAIARGCRASRRRRRRNAPSRIRAVPRRPAVTAGCSLPWPKMKNDRAVVVRWHSASFACGAEVWSLLDVQRTSGEAVGYVGPTRLTQIASDETVAWFGPTRFAGAVP
jgi:hypothetical protein